MTGIIFKCSCAVVCGVWLAAHVQGSWSLFLSVFLIVWGVHACVRQRLTAMGLGLCFGLLVVSLQTEGPRLEGIVTIQGRVVSTPVGQRADLSVFRWRRIDEQWTTTSGRVRVRFCDVPPSLGQTVSILGLARPIKDSVLPYAPNPYLVSSLSRVKTEVDCRMSSLAPQFSPPESKAHAGYVGVMYALATGDRSGVTNEMWQTLRNTGTSHLLAISGFHIGLVAWSAYAVARRFSHFVALWYPSGMNDRLLLIVPIIASWMYAMGAGLPVSALRATIMVSILVVMKMINRTICPLDMVGLAAILVLSIEPSALGSPGFQLSFMAVIGLIRMTPWFMAQVKTRNLVLKWLWGGIATTLSASLSTLPVAAWWFQEISWVSPLANLFALPWVAWGVVPLSFGAVWLPDPMGSTCLFLADYALWILFTGLEQISYAPLIIAGTPIACLIGILLCLLPKRWSVLGLMAAQVSCGTQSDALILTMLDVGHGESVLVTWPTGEHWLIDGGPPGRGVLQYLRRAGIESLDVVVVTHGHRDHVGGLWPVLEAFPVKAVWLGGSWDDRVVQIAARRGIPISMNPTGTFSADASSANEQSLVLPIHWGGFSVLLTGDIGTATEPQLMREYRAPIDILKVPHHGTKTYNYCALYYTIWIV